MDIGTSTQTQTGKETTAFNLEWLFNLVLVSPSKTVNKLHPLSVI